MEPEHSGSLNKVENWSEDPLTMEIWERRVRLGWSVKATAEDLNITRQTVWRRMGYLMESIRLDEKELVAHRKQELERLEEMEMKATEAFIRSDVHDTLSMDRATRTLMRIMERRSKLLGLDAPRRIEIEGLSRDPLTAEMDKIRDELQEIEVFANTASSDEEG